MVEKRFRLLLITALLLTTLAFPQGTAAAGSTISGAEIIATANAIRTSGYGLPALVENSALDSCAQWTADTMASIGATTHLVYLGYPAASARCANFGFGGGKTTFVTENWAMGASLSIDTLFYDYWADSAHMLPMTQSEYTYVGVGVSTASNGETYYILQAGAISGETAASASSSSSSSSSSGAAADVSQYMIPVTTATPDADGMVVHTVKYGQALITIAQAYGITLDELKKENGLTSDDILEGTKLKIKQVPTPTPTPVSTAPAVATSTLESGASEFAATSTAIAALPTVQVVKQQGFLPPFDQQTLGLAMMILSGLGMGASLYFAFRKPPQA